MRAGRAAIVIVGFMTAALACGSILGIEDDRGPFPPDGGGGGGETSTHADGGVVPSLDGGSTKSDDADTTLDAQIVDVGPVVCNETCQDAGGTCEGTTCAIACSGSSCKGDRPIENVVVCPDGHNCRLDCAGGGPCNDVLCTGGKACSFDCVEGDCKDSVCSSPTCVFRCGKDNCTGGPVGCDAGISCQYECVGECPSEWCCTSRTCVGANKNHCAP